MKGLQLEIEGNYAHFRKPETNNNPLSHDFITKTALIGLIGAVLGKEREEMCSLFPQLSEDLLYGVQIINPVKKESFGFTMHKAKVMSEMAPKYLELLKFPKFKIAVSLCNKRNITQNLFDDFTKSLKNNESKYTPVLGLHNCPAKLTFLSEGEFSDEKNDYFETKYAVSAKHILNIYKTEQFRIGFERIPTFQNDNFWNPSDKYVDVIYPSENNEITVKGIYYEYFNGDKLWLI